MSLDPTLLSNIPNTRDIGLKDIVFQNNSLDISAQGTTPRGMFIGDNGTKLFVIFSGVSEAKIARYDLSIPWDTNSGTFTHQKVITAQATDVTGLDFQPDGSKLFFGDVANDTLYEIVLDTIWDLTDTGTISSKVIDFKPEGIRFSPDGERLFATDDSNLHDWTVPTPFDITSITSTPQFDHVLDVNNTLAADLVFSTKGDRLYIMDFGDDNIYEYEMDSSYDPTNLTFSNKTLMPLNNNYGIFKSPLIGNIFITNSSGSNGPSVITLNAVLTPDVYFVNFNSTQSLIGEQPTGLDFAPDGLSFSFVNDTNQDVLTRVMSTAWDISTAVGGGFEELIETSNPTSVKFDSTGNRMYAVSNGNDTIFQYQLPTKFDGGNSPGTSSASLAVFANPLDMAITRDGTVFYLLNSDNTIRKYTMSTPFDISTGTLDATTFATGATEAQRMYLDKSEYRLFVTDAITATDSAVLQFSFGTPKDITSLDLEYTVPTADLTVTDGITGIFISNNFDQLFLIASGNEFIDEYTIRPDIGVSDNTLFWDSKTLPTAGIDNSPQGIRYNPDGTSIYLTGNIGNDITQLDLSHPFAISSWDGTQKVLDVSPQDSTPTGFSFSNDGTKIYLCGNGFNTIYQYDLTTPFELLTASYSGNDLPVVDNSPQGLDISSDGTKLFVIGNQTNLIYQYTLSIPFDLSTATQTGTFDMDGQNDAPRDIVLSRNGNQLLLIGIDNVDGDNIYEYFFETSNDISTLSFTGTTFDLSPFETNMTGIDVSRDNKHLILVGSDTDNMWQLELN